MTKLTALLATMRMRLKTLCFFFPMEHMNVFLTITAINSVYFFVQRGQGELAGPCLVQLIAGG